MSYKLVLVLFLVSPLSTKANMVSDKVKQAYNYCKEQKTLSSMAVCYTGGFVVETGAVYLGSKALGYFFPGSDESDAKQSKGLYWHEQCIKLKQMGEIPITMSVDECVDMKLKKYG